MSARDRSQDPEERKRRDFAQHGIDRNEVADRLRQAHANRDLTVAEAMRLRDLATAAPDLANDLATIDGLHRLFDLEAELFADVVAPIEASEEFDETYARLARVAAATEPTVRARLLHGGADRRMPAPRTRWHLRRIVMYCAAAAAVLIATLLYTQSRSAAPPLMPGAPSGEVLSGSTPILLEPVLRTDAPSLSWHPVVNATRYDVVVVDAAGTVVLARDDFHATNHRWELTPDELARLTARTGELRLRIVARDGAGLAVATSGDLRLTLR